MMERNKKIAIAGILVIVIALIGMPKGKKKREVYSGRVPGYIEEAVSSAAAVQGRRTEFAEWGRNPFMFTKTAGETLSEFSLNGVLWDTENPKAIINGRIVGVGDNVREYTVIEIMQNKVILSDGARDFELRVGQ
jgi:hypothetical protein